MWCALCSGFVSCAHPPGPFMAVLFAKLENMLQNSVYVNFLLTGLVAQLACHPQPLLRSFLLNTNMVFQPSVKSLLQVCDACMHGCVQAPWWARPTAGVAPQGWGGRWEQAPWDQKGLCQSRAPQKCHEVTLRRCWAL